MKEIRLPSVADIAAFDGMHCAYQYRIAVASGWRCPGCDRTAQECIRWAYINGSWYRKKYGDARGEAWTIALHGHHDHGTDSPRGRQARFPQTLMCCDCNGADGQVKRRFKLPAAWSFSPAEIRRFVKCRPHVGGAVIDWEVALMIYRQANS